MNGIIFCSQTQKSCLQTCTQILLFLFHDSHVRLSQTRLPFHLKIGQLTANIKLSIYFLYLSILLSMDLQTQVNIMRFCVNLLYLLIKNIYIRSNSPALQGNTFLQISIFHPHQSLHLSTKKVSRRFGIFKITLYNKQHFTEQIISQT